MTCDLLDAECVRICCCVIWIWEGGDGGEEWRGGRAGHFSIRKGPKLQNLAMVLGRSHLRTTISKEKDIFREKAQGKPTTLYLKNLHENTKTITAQKSRRRSNITVGVNFCLREEAKRNDVGKNGVVV